VVDQWTIVTEVALIRQIELQNRAIRIELFAIQELFQETGPDAFALSAETFAEARSWESLEKPCSVEFFVQIRGHYYYLELEILPGRTIIFRRARRR
jgi:hypothetical protein